MSSLPPFPQSYWVEPDLFCAGHYPGDRSIKTRDEKLEGLVQAGIRRVVNLIPENETGRNGEPFDPYAQRLQTFAKERDSVIECIRLGFPDGSIPDVSLMKTILDTIDASIAARLPVYVHCWGGHGRTSTVVGCYLVRHGSTPANASDRIMGWRANLPKNWFPFENQQQTFLQSWQRGQ